MLRREFLKAVGLAFALPTLPQEKVLCLNGVPIEEMPSEFKYTAKTTSLCCSCLNKNKCYKEDIALCNYYRMSLPAPCTIEMLTDQGWVPMASNHRIDRHGVMFVDVDYFNHQPVDSITINCTIPKLPSKDI